MIITHRGVDLGPENSMKGLKNSLDNKLEGIEADVSKRTLYLCKNSVTLPVMVILTVFSNPVALQ